MYQIISSIIPRYMYPSYPLRCASAWIGSGALSCDTFSLRLGLSVREEEEDLVLPSKLLGSLLDLYYAIGVWEETGR